MSLAAKCRPNDAAATATGLQRMPTIMVMSCEKRAIKRKMQLRS